MGKYEALKERKYYLNVSQRTIEWHQQSLRWLGVEEPTEQQLKDCVIRTREAGLKASSVNCHVCSINAYLAWLGSELRVPKLKEEEWLPETCTPDDITKFVAWKPKSRSGKRTRLLVLTLADTGLRLGEALNLRWPDVDLDNCLLTVLREGRKERKVPFSIELRKVLYKGRGAGLVFGTSTGTKLTRRNTHRDVLGIKQPPNFFMPSGTLGLPMRSNGECTLSFCNAGWGIQR